MKIMKKLLLAIVGLSGIIILGSFDGNPGINDKVMRAFHSEYGNPLNARWFANPQDDYVVFTQNNIVVRSEYDLQGNQLFALRYFDAKNLPSPVLNNVQGQFPNEKIDIVTEVTTPEGMAYVIQLESKNYLTTLISDMDGNIAVQSQLHKVG
jgi:hypothetical protein